MKKLGIIIILLAAVGAILSGFLLSYGTLSPCGIAYKEIERYMATRFGPVGGVAARQILSEEGTTDPAQCAGAWVRVIKVRLIGGPVPF